MTRILRAIVWVIVLGTLTVHGASVAAQSDEDIEGALRIFNRGKMLHQESRLDEAISSYREALDLDDQNAFIYNALGLALAAKRNFPEATKSFQTALAINPDLTDVHNNLGTVYAETGQREKAFESFSLVVRNPNYPTPEKALFNMGNMYLQERNFELAIMHFERAIKRNEKFALAHRGLGKAYLAMNEEDSAVRQFEKSLELYSEDVESLYELARIHQRKGENSLAADFYRRVVEIDRQSDLGRLSLASLDRLKESN